MSTAEQLPAPVRTATTPVVTAVSGPSVLRGLGLTPQQSPMGWTGYLGPSPDAAVPQLVMTTASAVPNSFVVGGADLYRFNCQACHRADGRGTGAAIPSLIDPIRSMSADIMRQRMVDKGHPVSAAFARELAAGSREDVLDRLRNGGERMPAFAHLSGAEIRALLAYVEWLAGVPGAGGGQMRLVEPASRVGEQVVKGTCHICHDATGPWPDRRALLEGAMPSLASVAGQRNLHDVVTKVRVGKPVIMGNPDLMYRGRMPVFDYLSDREVAAGYAYLNAYPPLGGPTRARVRSSSAAASP